MTDNIIMLPSAGLPVPAQPNMTFVREDFASYEEFHTAIMAAADALAGDNIIQLNSR